MRKLMNPELLLPFALIATSILTSVAGQTVIKLGVTAPATAERMGAGLMGLVTAIFTSPLLLAGLVLYGVGALAWIAVLSRLNLSVAYPFLALNFVLIALVSRFVLGEEIPLLRWVGIGCIVVGILVVARSG